MDVTGLITDRILTNYASHLAAQGRADGTIRARCYWPRRLARDHGCSPWQVTPAQATAWLAGHSWSAATRRQILTSLAAFYSWGGHDNPAAAITRPRQPRYSARPIPAQVLADALAAATGDDYWLLRLLATTGLRRSEAARLNSDQLDAGWLTVTGKGGVVRRVPVPDDVAHWIRGRRGWVFPMPEGGHRQPLGIAGIVRRLTGHGPHSIRHHYATTVYAAGHDMRAVQELLGHASISTTQIYVQTDRAALRLAASAAWSEAA